MRNLYFLLSTTFVCLMCACGGKTDNKPADSQQTLIMGKWNLQKQNYTVFVEGTIKSDTSIQASNKNLSYAQFDADNKFTSIGYYNSGGIGSISLGNVIAADTVGGTFSFAGLEFMLSTPSLGGFAASTLIFSTSNGVPLPVIRLVSQSAQITQLTKTILTLHLEYTTTQTVNTDTKTYKTLIDYFYTR